MLSMGNKVTPDPFSTELLPSCATFSFDEFASCWASPRSPLTMIYPNSRQTRSVTSITGSGLCGVSGS